jgi:hypothetical protein
MKRTTLFAVSLAFTVAANLRAQRKVDPLNEAEIAQVRDAALDPDIRLQLYVQFAKARLTALDRSRTDPKVADHALAIHDGLQSFLDIYDELDDNIDTFAQRQNDIRKPLKAIIATDAEFTAKLRALDADAQTHPEQLAQYDFLLKSSIETLEESAKDHRELMVEQEELAKHRKKETKKVNSDSHE